MIRYHLAVSVGNERFDQILGVIRYQGWRSLSKLTWQEGPLLKLDSERTDTEAQDGGLIKKRAQRNLSKVWLRGVSVLPLSETWVTRFAKEKSWLSLLGLNDLPPRARR